MECTYTRFPCFKIFPKIACFFTMVLVIRTASKQKKFTIVVEIKVSRLAHALLMWLGVTKGMIPVKCGRT